MVPHHDAQNEASSEELTIVNSLKEKGALQINIFICENSHLLGICLSYGRSRMLKTRSTSWANQMVDFTRPTPVGSIYRCYYKYIIIIICLLK